MKQICNNCGRLGRMKADGRFIGFKCNLDDTVVSKRSECSQPAGAFVKSVPYQAKPLQAEINKLPKVEPKPANKTAAKKNTAKKESIKKGKK